MSGIEQAIEENKLNEAEALCEQLLSENVFNIEALFYKAIILRKRNSFDEAIEVHNSLVNLMPNNADFIAERGLTFHFMNQEKPAIADLTIAIELEPENAYRYASRAFIRNYYGDSTGALEDYNKAIELDPDDAISLNNKGVIEENMGRFEEARASYGRSDNITGVDQTLDKMTRASAVDKAASPAKRKTLGIKEYFRILKQLFTSKAERQSFIDFLFKRK